jgi:hypothetical protein
VMYRELRISQLCQDWGQAIALYTATYNDDWRKLTPVVFLSRVEQANVILSMQGGTYGEDDVRKSDIERRNREILMKGKFPMYFPEE